LKGVNTIEIFKLFGSILVDSSKAEESISKTEKGAEGLATKLGNGIKTAGKWGLAIGAGAAAAGGALMALANKTAESADFIDKLSERTGINREELQRWKYAAEQSGADIGKLEVGMKKLSDTMDKANTGSKLSEEAFTRLGVSMDDLQKKSPSEMFNTVAAKLADMPDSAERNALGNQLLGKSYTELMPLLNAGSEGMGDLMARADELGLVMSEDAVKANVVFGDSMADVKSAFGAIFMHLSNEFLPILQSFLDWVLGHMPEIQRVISVVFNVISKVTETAYKWFNDYLLPVFSTLFKWVQTNWPKIRDTIKGVFDTVSPLVRALWQLFEVSLLPIFKTLFTWVSNNFGTIGTVIGDVFGGVIKVAEKVIGVFTGVVDGIKTAIDWLTSWNNKDVKDKTPRTGGYDGSHAGGLAYVPFDGYTAQLHKGERVLTAEENKGLATGITNTFHVSAVIREEADIKKVADELFSLQKASNRGRGVLA
jgi:hypothetical protein